MNVLHQRVNKLKTSCKLAEIWMYPGWHLGGAKGASDDATLVVLKRTHSIEVLKFFIDYNMLLTYVKFYMAIHVGKNFANS